MLSERLRLAKDWIKTNCEDYNTCQVHVCMRLLGFSPHQIQCCKTVVNAGNTLCSQHDSIDFIKQAQGRTGRCLVCQEPVVSDYACWSHACRECAMVRPRTAYSIYALALCVKQHIGRNLPKDVYKMIYDLCVPSFCAIDGSKVHIVCSRINIARELSEWCPETMCIGSFFDAPTCIICRSYPVDYDQHQCSVCAGGRDLNGYKLDDWQQAQFDVLLQLQRQFDGSKIRLAYNEVHGMTGAFLICWAGQDDRYHVEINLEDIRSIEDYYQKKVAVIILVKDMMINGVMTDDVHTWDCQEEQFDFQTIEQAQAFVADINRKGLDFAASEANTEGDRK